METGSVWVIEDNAESEHTLGIYTTEALANKVHAKIKRGVVKERQLDQGTEPTDVKYWVTMVRDGTDVKAGQDTCCTELDTTYEVLQRGPAVLLARVWAPYVATAIAMANRRRLYLIDTGAWHDC